MRDEKPFRLTEISSLRGLMLLNPREFEHRDPLNNEEFDHIFRLCGAMWQHSGDPKMPHVQLTAGGCSDGFVDVLRVLHYTNLCEIMAIQMARVFQRALESDANLPRWERGNKNWVIGSDHAAAIFSQRVAAHLGSMHDYPEKGSEKELPGGKKEKTQNWKRFEVQPDEMVLQVEELVTTTSTLEAVRKGIVASQSQPVNFFPHIMTLVHRSPQMDFYGFPMLFVRHYDIKKWDPADCPLCALGSKRILEPKKHWAELTGQTG
jgi:hypothetical protein